MSYGVPGVIKVKVVSHHHMDKEKEISITDETTLKTFLSACSSKLNIQAKRVFTIGGQEITKVEHVAPGEKFIISEGEDIRNILKHYRRSVKDKPENSFNITIIGPAAVGKSSIAVRYALNQYTADYVPTIEDTYKKFETIDDQTIGLNILDTSGSEDFQSTFTQWLHEKDGLLLVYSVDKYTNFQEVDKYVKQLSYHDPDGDIVKILVANKVDVQNREISTEEGMSYAQKIGAEYIETSAKSDYNVTQAFVTLAIMIRNRKRSLLQDMKNKSSSSIQENNEKLDTKGPIDDDKNSNKGFMNWLFSKCNLI